ncbi:MAG: hypothetical protein RR869_07560 [Lachnospiraceae bacterium]
MKKTKRTLAFIGVILLVGLYVSTLIFAFVDHSASLGLLKVSVALTILVPVLLYAYTLIYKLTKKEDDTSEDDS